MKTSYEIPLAASAGPLTPPLCDTEPRWLLRAPGQPAQANSTRWIITATLPCTGSSKWVPPAVQSLATKGSRAEIWNRKNKNGWTPLRIAEGVHRGMNFRASPETAAVLREVMTAAGVSTVVEPEAAISGLTR